MTNPPTPDSPTPDSPAPDATTPSAPPPAPPASSSPQYSAPQEPAPQYSAPGATPYGQPTPTPPGRVLSIVGLVLAFVAAPIGLVISIVAAVKLGKAGQPKGLAIAGIIVGAIITIFWIIAIIFFVAVFANIFGTCAELGPGVWDIDGVTYRCG